MQIVERDYIKLRIFVSGTYTYTPSLSILLLLHLKVLGF